MPREPLLLCPTHTNPFLQLYTPHVHTNADPVKKRKGNEYNQHNGDGKQRLVPFPLMWGEWKWYD